MTEKLVTIEDVLVWHTNLAKHGDDSSLTKWHRGAAEAIREAIATHDSNARYWLSIRAKVIAALAEEGLEIWSDKDRVWLHRSGPSALATPLPHPPVEPAKTVEALEFLFSAIVTRADSDYLFRAVNRANAALEGAMPGWTAPVGSHTQGEAMNIAEAFERHNDESHEFDRIEREAFEAFITPLFRVTNPGPTWLGMGGDYYYAQVKMAWVAWQARAALATPPIAVPDLTEMEIIDATEHIDTSRDGYFIHIARAIEFALAKKRGEHAAKAGSGERE